MLLTEGKLLLWHFIISVVAAVLLLWSAQLTRNFHFTNGHWFPIADTVYCLPVSRWIIPRPDVTSLPVWGWWHWWCVASVTRSRGQWSPGPSPTSRVTICIRWHYYEWCNSGISFRKHPDGDDTQAWWQTIPLYNLRVIWMKDDYQPHAPLWIVRIKHVWCEWGVFWVEIQLCWWEISVCLHISE